MRNPKKALPFIFITILVDSIGVGIIFPVMATLLSSITGKTIEQTTTYSGWLMTTYALTQFFFAPVLGGLSDRFGRRPVLLISLLGLGVDYLFLAFSSSLWFLFVGRLIAGLCGASFTTAFSFIADISEPEKKAQNFGLVGAAFGLGFILGPFIGGMLSSFGPRAPFIAAAFLSLLNFIYGFLVLPESLPKDLRRKFDWKRSNALGAFYQLKKRKDIQLLLLSMFMIYLAGQVMPSIWTFFTKYKFNWTDAEVGWSLAFVGLSVAAVQGGLIGFSKKILKEKQAVVVGLLLYFFGLIMFSFSNTGYMMYVCTAVYVLGGIGPPMIQALISTKTNADEQGEIQGLITAMTSLASIFSPLIMTSVFYFFTNKNAPFIFPGASFLLAAILMLFGLMFYLIGNKKVNKPNLQ